MTEQTYSVIVTPELLAGAIENNEYDGFLHDYHVLHFLIRKYKPRTFFEIGTNMGTGTNIICNAIQLNYANDIPDYIDRINSLKTKVYSLDLPTELAHISLQHPISEGKGDKVGSVCKFPYTQLRGDSLTFGFSDYPCEGYYIDGEHDYKHPYIESVKCLKQYPKIIIWHDSDIAEVWKAITTAISDYHSINLNGHRRFNYDFIRVTDTRISYALRK